MCTEPLLCLRIPPKRRVFHADLRRWALANAASARSSHFSILARPNRSSVASLGNGNTGSAKVDWEPSPKCSFRFRAFGLGIWLSLDTRNNPRAPLMLRILKRLTTNSRSGIHRMELREGALNLLMTARLAEFVAFGRAEHAVLYPIGRSRKLVRSFLRTCELPFFVGLIILPPAQHVWRRPSTVYSVF